MVLLNFTFELIVQVHYERILKSQDYRLECTYRQLNSLKVCHLGLWPS